MKKYKSILWSLIALATFSACNNENYSEPPVEGNAGYNSQITVNFCNVWRQSDFQCHC